jgi:hypothetical protein
MSLKTDRPYAIGGNSQSEQAEPSTVNRGAGTIQMRILIELQVISMLLHNAYESTDDLAKLRQDVADSIT